MYDLIKEAIRWVFGGGALALATFLGTTAYQQGQLQIERERHLRDFLDRYVVLATKGSYDERVRFVQYWRSLDVAAKIGVNLENYEKALTAELQQTKTFAAVLRESEAAGIARAAPVPDLPDPTVSEPPASPEPPPQQTVAQQALVQSLAEQTAYVTSRSRTLSALSAEPSSPAAALEREAFEALLANNIPAARDGFAAAEQAWPGYHNVFELQRLLGRESGRLATGETGLPAERFRALLQRILADYSWGMPADIKARMQAAAG